MKRTSFLSMPFAALLVLCAAPAASGMYHPTLGRFVQRDPVGHDEGMHLLIYVRDNPIGVVDPLGQSGVRTTNDLSGAAERVLHKYEESAAARRSFYLYKVTKTGPEAGQCGGYIWITEWGLDKPTLRGGFVIQRVDAKFEVEDCEGKALKKGPPSPFWEAWYIAPGKAEPTDDDTWWAKAMPCTRGRVVIRAEARYYDGLTSLPPSFKPGAVDATAGPATTTAPNLEGGSNAAPHNIELIWDCCPPNPPNSPTQFEQIE